MEQGAKAAGLSESSGSIPLIIHGVTKAKQVLMMATSLPSQLPFSSHFQVPQPLFAKLFSCQSQRGLVWTHSYHWPGRGWILHTPCNLEWRPQGLCKDGQDKLKPGTWHHVISPNLSPFILPCSFPLSFPSLFIFSLSYSCLHPPLFSSALWLLLPLSLWRPRQANPFS